MVTRLIACVAVATSAFLVALVSFSTSTATPQAVEVPMPDESWAGWQLQRRDDRYNAWLGWIQFHVVPNFTKVGYEVRQIDPEMYTTLKNYFDVARKNAYPETPANILLPQSDPPLILPTTRLHAQLLDLLKPQLEEWAGVQLVPSNAYGIRIYQRGNYLVKHVDRPTLVISAIVHIAAEVDEPWPILILNNTGQEHSVVLQPGQMLFYESARLMHGRPTPLDGTYFASIFVHFTPTNWMISPETVGTHLPVGWDRGSREDL